jgi:Fe-S cluster assembly protein SufD
MNTAFAYEGTCKIVADKPIEIMYFSTGNESALMVQPRNLVIVGENSVQIIERHQNDRKSVLTNSVTEIFAQKNVPLLITIKYKTQSRC